jgi:hypothetical protein
MKLSVIFGIIQMFAGTCLKGANAVYSTRNLTFLRIRSHGSFRLFVVCLHGCLDLHEVDYQLELSMLSPRVSTPTAMAGVVLIMRGEWTVCDQSGDVYPWGYSCTGNDDTAAKCDYNFSGSGDGCQPLILLLPSSTLPFYREVLTNR